MIQHDDGAIPSGSTGLRDPEAALVARLQALSTLIDDEPDELYRARARARLVAMAAVRTPVPATRPLASRLLALRSDDRPPSRWRGRLTAGLAGAAVGVTGLAALVAVAAGAQPGDPLYDLKRGTEQTQLALAGESRGQTLLELARTRLDELRTVTDDPTLVSETLATMDQQTTEAAGLLTARAVAERDAGTLDDLAAWSDQQSSGLEALRSELPEESGPAYSGSADLLDALATRTTGLVAALDCPSGPATVGEDALGPVPGLCLPEAPTPAPGTSEPGPSPGPTGPTGPAGSAVPPDVAASPTPSAPGTVPGTDPGTAVPAPVPGTGSAPTAGVPTTPGGLVPSGPLLPQVPGTTGNAPTRETTPPVITVPLPGPITLCLPPLATLGDC